MVDATISRVRLRDLARLGRFRRRAGGFAASAATYASRRPSVTDATSIGDGLAPRLQSVQLAPRHRRSRGINHLVTSVARSSLGFARPTTARSSGWHCRRSRRWRRSRSTSLSTAIVGHLGRSQLAALGVAAAATGAFAIFNFLQYGTTAQVARARGAGRAATADELGVQHAGSPGAAASWSLPWSQRSPDRSQT